MEVRFSYPLLRVVNHALPDLRALPLLKKQGNLWRSGMLFVGPWAVATSGDQMTVAFDKTVDNERAVIFFPRQVRRMFRRRGLVRPRPAVWADGAWSVQDRMEVSGARKINDFLVDECPGGMGSWAGWDWLSILRQVALSPDCAWPVAFTASLLRSVAVSASDFAGQPLGFHPKRMGRVLVTYADPRVVSILSPWRVNPVMPEWAGEISEGKTEGREPRDRDGGDRGGARGHGIHDRVGGELPGSQSAAPRDSE